MSYTNKTQPTTLSAEQYLAQNFKGKEKLQEEALILIDFYTKTTGFPCVMWNKIFGFREYNYLDSKSGKHSYLATGFAISSSGFTLYNIMGWEAYKKDLERLGKYKLSGKSCLAIKSIGEIDSEVLKNVVEKSLIDLFKKYS